MKKSVEMKQKMEGLKAHIRELNRDGRVDDAHAKIAEMDALQKQIEVEERLEAEDVLEDSSSPVEPTKKGYNENEVFNKLVFNKRMSEEEMAFARAKGFFNEIGSPGQVEGVPERGGYLVPKHQFSQLLEFRRQYYALKDLCTVIEVNTMEGTLPTMATESDMLIAFEELNELQEDEITFGALAWKLKDYGLLIKTSNQLKQDAFVDIVSIIGQNLARRGINRENHEILQKLGALEATVVADHLGVNTALNVSLDPAISATSHIITNQTGFNHLDILVDANGHPLLKESLKDATQKVYNGRAIHVISDALLPSEGTVAPIYVGDLSQYLYFFDRLGVEIALSEHAGFTKYATYLRAVQRFDVQVADAGAMVKLTLDTATPAGE